MKLIFCIIVIVSYVMLMFCIVIGCYADKHDRDLPNIPTGPYARNTQEYCTNYCLTGVCIGYIKIQFPYIIGSNIMANFVVSSVFRPNEFLETLLNC